MRTAVVIPVGPGRAENVKMVLNCLAIQTVPVAGIVVMGDGLGSLDGVETWATEPVVMEEREAHTPGHEQPRNIGVRLVEEHFPTADHVWFLDSDVIVESDCLQRYVEAHNEASVDRVLIGPYEWLPPGVRHPMPDLRNDFRWPGFKDPSLVHVGELNVGLACFSGNLVWPLAEFVRLGGFWNEIHHGRCEDGELGLRAVACGTRISFAPLARGWHLDHPTNMTEKMRRNARDVPMINQRHPWVAGSDVFVVEEDGRRFDQRCGTCHQMVNTIDWWNHMAAHDEEVAA